MSTAVSRPERIGARAIAIVMSLLVALSGVALAPAAASAAEAPTLTVSPAQNLDPGVENVLTVTGTGYTGEAAAMGVYVLFGDTNVWSGGGPLVSDGWISIDWVMSDRIVDGTFTSTITVPAGALAQGTNYHVATSAAHRLSATNRSLDAFAPVTLAAPAPAASTSTVLSASASSITAGQPVTLTASVTPAEAEGTVTFSEGGQPLGAPQPVAQGSASFTTAAVSAGEHSFTAAFTPSNPAEFAASTATPVVITARADTPEVPKPKVSASVTDASKAGLRVSATVENIVLRAAAEVQESGKADQGVYVGIIEKDRVQEYSRDAKAGAAQDFAYKTAIQDGKVTLSIEVPAAKLDRSKEYVAVSWLAHGLLSESRMLGQADLGVTAAQWDAVFGAVPPAPAVGALQWKVHEKFVTYIEKIAGGSTQLHGAASRSGATFGFKQGKGGSWNAETATGRVPFLGGVSFSAHAGALRLSIVDPVVEVTGPKTAAMTAVVNGKRQPLVNIDLSAAKKTVAGNGEVTWTGAATRLRPESVAAFQQYAAGEAFAPITFTVGAATDAQTTKPVPQPQAPKPQSRPRPQAVAASNAQQAGSLTWGVSSGFRGYVTGRIAKGSISTNGVGSSGGAYVFPQATGGSWNPRTQTGTVQYSGVVTFTGHKGLLVESFANPVISITSATSGTITAGGRTFGLNLGAGSRTVGPNGEVTWSGVPLSGSISGGGSAGGGAGSGSFGADPVSFTVGAASRVQYGSTTQTDVKAKREPAATPPATEGITVVTPADEIVPGGTIEFVASGYEANERDVLVVLYSEPTVLDTKAGANAVGEVRWIGTLPEDVPPGQHTITLQGSHDAGAVITVADPQDTQAAKPIAVDGEATPKATAAGVSGGPDSPIWMWWVGACALVALALTLGGLVAAQRRSAIGANVEAGSDG